MNHNVLDIILDQLATLLLKIVCYQSIGQRFVHDARKGAADNRVEMANLMHHKHCPQCAALLDQAVGTTLNKATR